MVTSCKLVRLIAAVTGAFEARLRAVPPGDQLTPLRPRLAPYAAARPSVAEYDAFMADVRRLGETADMTNPELADLLRYDEDRINVRLRIYLHSRGLKFPHVLTRYQHNLTAYSNDTAPLQLNPDTRLMQSTISGTWSGMVTLLLKPTYNNTIQAPDFNDDFDFVKEPTVETAREFWEAAGVQANKMRLLLPDPWTYPPPTTGAIMPANEAVVLLRNLPPGYAVEVKGHERQLDVICATGLVED